MNSDALAARIENLLGSSQSSGAENLPSQRPPPIPNHEIIAPIGRGSYGEVWLARSVTGALRAVKVVWRNRFASDRPYEREFHGIVQFEPISRSHPGVVNVLHVGRDDAAGCFFYVMELADDASKRSDGVMESRSNEPTPPLQHSNTPALQHSSAYSPRTLASELKSRGRLPVTDVVSLGVQLAGALGHLHRHGLVHRDVKPSNVIFVQGQPKLADIGLVTSANEERSFVGTEGFIPPEGPGTERADLFSLGRLLYEAVTGKDRCDFPGLPGDLDRWPKGEREALLELNEVLARACAAEAKKRHSNTAELAGDLNLILAGRSVRRSYRIERRLRRATLVSGVALALVIATTFSTWLQHRQREQSEARAKREAALREQTQNSLARAEAAEHESEQQLYTALLEQARATVLSRGMGQRVRALDAIRRAAAISNSAELRREVFAALALPDLRFERELPYGEEFTVRDLDPSFERIALARGGGPVEIRSVADDKLLATLPASTNLPAHGCYWSSDGLYAAIKRDRASNGWRTDWEIWDAATWRRVLLFQNLPRVAFSFHPRLPRVLIGRTTGDLSIWNLEDGQEIVRLPRLELPAQLKFSPEGDRFAAADARGPKWVVCICDATSGLLLASNVFSETVGTFEWHPSGRWLALAARSGAIYWMDAQTGELRVLGRHKAEAWKTEFSPDGAYLITGGWEREMICWDARTLQRAFGIALNSWLPCFRADSRALGVQTRTGLQLYSFEQPSGYREFAEDLGTRLDRAAFSSDGRWLAASASKRMGVWDLTANGPGALEEKARQAYCCFTPDGRELFASRLVDNARDCFRWEITPATNSGAPNLKRLPLHRPPGFAFLSLSSNTVVITSTNGTQFLARDEVEAGKDGWMRTYPGFNRVSPDGRWLGVFRPYAPSLYIHRLPGLERVAKLTHLANIAFFDFSPLGDEVALHSSRGVELWSTATWARTRALTNFTGPALYAPDGRSLWLTKELRMAGLYDRLTLEPRLLLPTGMLPLAVSPDGRHLAVSVDMQRLQVWDLVNVREQLRELGLDWAENQ